MLHALAMLIGLTIVWLLLVPHWSGLNDVALAAGVAVVCVLATARLGGFGRSVFSHPFQFLALTLGRTGAVLRGAAAALSAGVFGGGAVKPALVRMKLRPSSDVARTMLTELASAAPGGVAVDVGDDSLLVHVLNENDADAANLGQLESRVTSALDGKRRA